MGAAVGNCTAPHQRSERVINACQVEQGESVYWDARNPTLIIPRCISAIACNDGAIGGNARGNHIRPHTEFDAVCGKDVIY